MFQIKHVLTQTRKQTSNVYSGSKGVIEMEPALLTQRTRRRVKIYEMTVLGYGDPLVPEDMLGYAASGP